MALIYNATFDSGTRVLSLLDKAGNVISSCEVPSKSKGNELTLTATADNSSVKLIRMGTVDNTYEVNTGSGWGSYKLYTVIKLNKGQSCKWRCTSHPTTFFSGTYVQFVMTGSIEASGEVYSMLSSNLIDVTTLNGYAYAFYCLFDGCTSLTQAPALPATTLADGCYYNMFKGCKSLTQAPQLPATTLAKYCYGYMFSSCTSLTQAPALPATALAERCYYRMFSGCLSLTQAPQLPATTRAGSCYHSMFESCKSLTQAPALPATTLENDCYRQMFFSCKSLTQAPALPATTLKIYCYSSMFDSCSNLKEVRIAATRTASNALDYWLYGVSATGDFYCDPNATIFPTDSPSGIPSGWTRHNINALKALTLTATADNSSVKLTKNGTLDNTFEVDKGNGWEGYAFGTVIPLNAGQSCKWRCSAHPTTQSDQNYVQFVMTGKIEASGDVNSMLSSDFENLTSLSRYNYAFRELFKGCTSLTQAPQLPATTLADHCYEYMFRDCTSLTQAPQLPATTLAEYCYYFMFSGCKSLTQAPQLPATTLVNSCYEYLFEGCTSLTQAPQLPATTLKDYCYKGMFYGCTSLTQAPALPATALKVYCYSFMFYGCSKLNEVRVSANASKANGALDYWLKGVSATGDFYCDPNAEIFPKDDISGIPTGWVRHALADYPVTP